MKTYVVCVDYSNGEPWCAFSSRGAADAYIATHPPVSGIQLDDANVLPYYSVIELDLDPPLTT